VQHVAAVDGVEAGEPIVTELFGFRPVAGPDATGEFVSTGIEPALVGTLAGRGEAVDGELFVPGPDWARGEGPS
jgi:hypothetical protein